MDILEIKVWFLGPIGPLELGLSVCVSVGSLSGKCSLGIGEWGIGNIKLPSWMTVLIKLIDDLTL